jgi:uncharacterized protein DUF1707
MAASPDLRPDVRVGDAERAAAVDRLAAHAAAGRLTVAELEERVEAAHRAVHARDLAVLEADLPGPPARRARRAPAPRPAGTAVLGVALLLVALAVLASAAAGHPVPAPLFLGFVLWRVHRHRGSWPSTPAPGPH